MQRRIAAPAPERPYSPRRGDDGLEPAIHTACIEWARWCATRGRYGAPRPPGSVMEQLLRVPSSAGDERSGRCDQDIARFNHAVIHHEDQLARHVFEAHFLRKQRNVKRLAFEVGVSRRTWYRIVNTFARQVYARSFGAQ